MKEREERMGMVVMDAWLLLLGSLVGAKYQFSRWACRKISVFVTRLCCHSSHFWWLCCIIVSSVHVLSEWIRQVVRTQYILTVLDSSWFELFAKCFGLFTLKRVPGKAASVSYRIILDQHCLDSVIYYEFRNKVFWIHSLISLSEH